MHWIVLYHTVLQVQFLSTLETEQRKRVLYAMVLHGMYRSLFFYSTKNQKYYYHLSLQTRRTFFETRIVRLRDGWLVAALARLLSLWQSQSCGGTIAQNRVKRCNRKILGSTCSTNCSISQRVNNAVKNTLETIQAGSGRGRLISQSYTHTPDTDIQASASSALKSIQHLEYQYNPN